MKRINVLVARSALTCARVNVYVLNDNKIKQENMGECTECYFCVEACSERGIDHEGC